MGQNESPVQHLIIFQKKSDGVHLGCSLRAMLLRCLKSLQMRQVFWVHYSSHWSLHNRERVGINCEVLEKESVLGINLSQLDLAPSRPWEALTQTEFWTLRKSHLRRQ